MDKFDSLRLYCKIVELSSFTRAAGVQQIPRATATYAMQQLEQRLNTRLLERTTRQVKPTPDGLAFYQRCIRILAELEDAEASLSTTAANPTGQLRLGLHGVHASQIIIPALPQFRSRYPRLDIVISSSDRLVDMVRESIDVVIRIGIPKDSTLTGKKLTELKQVVCASPAYLKQYGVPTQAEHLAQHQAVGFFSSDHNISYPFSFIRDGKTEDFPARGWLSVNDAESYTAAALAGCGLIQVPEFRIRPLLERGMLVEVLAHLQSPLLPVHALYPQHHQLSPRVRVFIDWVSQLYQQKFTPLSG
ncbi:LysR family transcriptional regulator [Chromatiaceae bacterium AAb-1]|nr:LysR family transcriptional regulator [Chromatiaceae bacterium AAb-1]